MNCRVPSLTPNNHRWPADYVAVEPDRFLIRADLLIDFETRGWRTAGDVLSDPRIPIFRRVEDRENGIVEFMTDQHSPTRGFIKRHHVPASRREWWRGKESLDPPGWHEAIATGWCQQAQIATANVLAAGFIVDAAGKPSESFFLSEELVGFLPADRWATENLPQDPADPRRRAFLACLADMAGRFHQEGLFHRDFYWCHFFVRENEPALFDLRLIDLQRVHRPTWRTWRWRLKDLAQLLFSAPPGFLIGRERQQWLARYFGTESVGAKERAWLLAIEARAEIYKWREKSA